MNSLVYLVTLAVTQTGAFEHSYFNSFNEPGAQGFRSGSISSNINYSGSQDLQSLLGSEGFQGSRGLSGLQGLQSPQGFTGGRYNRNIFPSGGLSDFWNGNSHGRRRRRNVPGSLPINGIFDQPPNSGYGPGDNVIISNDGSIYIVGGHNPSGSIGSDLPISNIFDESENEIENPISIGSNNPGYYPNVPGAGISSPGGGSKDCSKFVKSNGLTNKSIPVQLLSSVNCYRQAAGLNPLQLDEPLNHQAQKHSQHQAARGIMDHTVDGHTMSHRCRAARVNGGCAENVAQNPYGADHVMNRWMNSPGHRRNIMNPSYTHMGSGMVNSYWTQIFAQRF